MNARPRGRWTRVPDYCSGPSGATWQAQPTGRNQVNQPMRKHPQSKKGAPSRLRTSPLVFE